MHKLITSREIGAKIKALRRTLGISQEELAETIGVTYQQIQRYENGTNKLNVENIQLIAKALSVTVAALLESDKGAASADKTQPSAIADEQKLLNHFRAIKKAKEKNLVIEVARLASKATK